jgi:hypothetical protein
MGFKSSRKVSCLPCGKGSCHKLPRISSAINILQKGPKEQTCVTTGTHPAELVVTELGEQRPGAVYVTLTQAPWLKLGLEVEAKPWKTKECGE